MFFSAVTAPPATCSRSCSDNSAGFTSCFASCSIFSTFLVSSLMVFLLFEMSSFVNSGAPRKHPNRLPSLYKVQTDEKRGQSSFSGEQTRGAAVEAATRVFTDLLPTYPQPVG